MYSNQALFSYQIFMYYTWIFMLKLIKTAKVLFQVHFKCNWFCIAVGWSKPQKELKAFSFYRFQDSIMHQIAWVWPWQVFKKECSMMINLPFISRCSFKRWKIAVLPKSSWKIGWKERRKSCTTFERENSIDSWGIFTFEKGKDFVRWCF